MWSVGVIIYILLSAAPPFYGKTDAEMNAKIRAGYYRFPDKYWAHISSAAKDCITRLLTVDPARRMSALDALQHDWVVSIGPRRAARDPHACAEPPHPTPTGRALAGVYTNDLFSSGTAQGVPVMQARFNEFNTERRATARPRPAFRELLGLPDEEEELHSFRCAHSERPGHLLLTTAQLAFLAYDQSTMFSLPILEVRAAHAYGGVRGRVRPTAMGPHAPFSTQSPGPWALMLAGADTARDKLHDLGRRVRSLACGRHVEWAERAV
jgi:hypothetical protein